MKLVAVRTERLYIDIVEPRRIVVLTSTDGLQGLSSEVLNRDRTVIPNTESASEAWKTTTLSFLFEP